MVAPQLAAVFTKLQTLSTSDHASVVSMNIFVALLCACIGVFIEVIILLTSEGKSSHLLVFSEDLFFIHILPPIIFNTEIGHYTIPKEMNKVYNWLTARLRLEG
ncbi:Sodium/hydrogen exchanger 1 -like protein [Gossypium arboreum]|uniref:Sodium/hydrogen exchanger 1-like protein n=1 Tax=Gossypium arboreum TaxID=29729 RepID=A0A0B0NNC4_GOSAR|nr:Sodium/hydrogen exchanger 1 -like protein [Gossypium arboreum]